MPPGIATTHSAHCPLSNFSMNLVGKEMLWVTAPLSATDHSTFEDNQHLWCIYSVNLWQRGGWNTELPVQKQCPDQQLSRGSDLIDDPKITIVLFITTFFIRKKSRISHRAFKRTQLYIKMWFSFSIYQISDQQWPWKQHKYFVLLSQL